MQVDRFSEVGAQICPLYLHLMRSQRLDDCLLWSDWVGIASPVNHAFAKFRWLPSLANGVNTMSFFFLETCRRWVSFVQLHVIFERGWLCASVPSKMTASLSRPLMVFGVYNSVWVNKPFRSTSFLSLKRSTISDIEITEIPLLSETNLMTSSTLRFASPPILSCFVFWCFNVHELDGSGIRSGVYHADAFLNTL